MAEAKFIKIQAELTGDEALQLEQFLTRVSWETFRAHAENDHNANVMQEAAEKLRNALAANGYTPR
jgi:hypothetical protein